MRVLHTSDWHLGKKTEGFDRLVDQSEALDEICDICDNYNVELVIVAGDVFDTSVPSADAERLLYRKLVDMARGRAVAVIAGNHDDATRLCAASPIASESNVFFCGNIYGEISSPSSALSPVAMVKGGEGFGVFQNPAGERVYVGMLPYPTEARFGEKASGEEYSFRVRRWIDRCLSGNAEHLPQILVSHLFTAGGITTEGEREISLGGVRAMDRESFPLSDYTALGHLHKRQVIDEKRNIIYSGSILQYTFDEAGAEKSVTLFDIGKGGVSNIIKIPLSKGRRLCRITAFSVAEAARLLEGREELAELTLKLKSPLNREESAYLCSKFPNIISLKLSVEGSENSPVKGRKQLGDRQLFEECYKRRFGDYPDGELTELYLSLLEQVK